MSFNKKIHILGVLLSMVLYGGLTVGYVCWSVSAPVHPEGTILIRWAFGAAAFVLIGVHLYFLRNSLSNQKENRVVAPPSHHAQDETSKWARNESLAKISHEIRTPLNGIIGMTEVALTTRLDENQRHIIKIIENESNHLLELINGVLDFSKIEAGKLTLEATAFDLSRLLEALAETGAVQAAHKGLEFNLYQPPDMPRRVVGDRTRLRQVLLNLVSNAVKFTTEGEISVKADLISRRVDGATVRFTVEDTGIGIADDKQATIFDSFTQADETTTRLYGGTGLGTTISRSLVEIMGGRLQLESRSGRGTRVWFELDLTPEPDAPQLQDEAPPGGQPKHVLMVDDCHTSRRFALKYLQAMGCRTQVAEDGPQALEMLQAATKRKDPYDLIITDFRMPQMNGYELARHTRMMDTYRTTPIIAVSGLQEIAGGEDFRSMGFDRCLAKPLIFDDLKSAIREVCTPRSKADQCNPTMASDAECEAQPQASILLAEDYPANQQVVMMHLQSSGYQVDLAENGQAAVRMASRTAYDLILMDLDMPVMDGYTATRTIRLIEQQERPGFETPIIALTAHATETHETRCRRSGANDFLTKPIRRERLLKTVRQWLENCERKALSGSRPTVAPAPVSKPGLPTAPMDWPLALEEFMGRADRLSQVLNDFQHQIQGQLTEIEQALSNGDAVTVKRQAHTIMGGAANLIANPLSEAAARLELLAESDNLTDAPRALNTLKHEAERLRMCTQHHGTLNASVRREDKRADTGC